MKDRNITSLSDVFGMDPIEEVEKLACELKTVVANRKEAPRHFDGQCTSSCRRVGCPDDELDLGDPEVLETNL